MNRFALVAGVLALGVAACGDDVQVVEPTPPVPPPPPAVTASMAPASASVAVGNSVVFAVNASGGVAGEAASWTCASSNTGIATVSVTSAGCQATGVTAGEVTITAAVSKSGESVNVGAQLTVTSDEEPAGDPAFILISSIRGEENAGDPLKGSVNVVVNVERGDQELEELLLLVDGEEVASQSFGGAHMAPPADEAAEQAVHGFTLSFDSGEYDMETGATMYMNGEHTISAELEIHGAMGHETVSSNAITVEFDNDDGVHAAVSGLGNSAMNATTGELWHGGPGADLTITAVPVTYSSGSVASVTLLGICGAKAATDSEAPYEFKPDCKASTPATGVTAQFSLAVGGRSVEVEGSLNDGVFPLRLDYEAPDAPHFMPNPNKREGGWLNASVTLDENSTSKKNGWLVYNDANAGDGVGGYTPVLRAAKKPSDGSVSTAVAADPASLGAIAMAVAAAGASKANEYCAVITAMDLLGNESKLPKADADCAAHDAYVGGTDDAPTYAAGLLAGVDLTAPTIKFSPASPKADDNVLRSSRCRQRTRRPAFVPRSPWSRRLRAGTRKRRRRSRI